MLKNFMQPSTKPTVSPLDANRMIHSGYPPKTSEAPRSTEPTKPVETAKSEIPQPKKHAHGDEGSKLIVGPNITLKGSEITDCEILVVEGRVEASMNSRDIRIAEQGVFSGKAEIDVAEIHGYFEGELTARKRLVVYSTGRVSGTIRYGAMMVEEGGTITGNVAMIEGAANEADTPKSAMHEPTPDKKSELEEIDFASAISRNQGAKRRG
jgi:cytoskeletal protein CcmA (bactofilin family)